MSVSSGQRAVVFVSVGAALAALVAGHAAAGGRDRTTMISIKRPAATEAAFGGEGYGALAAPASMQARVRRLISPKPEKRHMLCGTLNSRLAAV